VGTHAASPFREEGPLPDSLPIAPEELKSLGAKMRVTVQPDSRPASDREISMPQNRVFPSRSIEPPDARPSMFSSWQQLILC
jgi:hypothetical protein